MKEIVINYMLSLKAQYATSVSYQTVKKAMSNLIKVQYYESKLNQILYNINFRESFSLETVLCVIR